MGKSLDSAGLSLVLSNIKKYVDQNTQELTEDELNAILDNNIVMGFGGDAQEGEQGD